jgi:uncharacterized integral membrane protein
MRGLVKVIPMFIALIVLSFLGTLFVLANQDSVSINLGTTKTPPVALGLVVLTSVLIGMIASGILCSVEVLALFMQNKALRKKLAATRNVPPPKLDTPLLNNPIETPVEPNHTPPNSDEPSADEPARGTAGSGRFTPL